MRAVVIVALGGCAQLVEPEVGPPLHAACADTDHDPAHDVSFATTLEPLIEEYRCRDCHTANGRTPIGLLTSGLDMTSYATLRAGGTRSSTSIIVPGKPCESVLIQKLGAGPPFGSRMPLNGPDFLEVEDLQAFADWIAEGAHDN